MRALALCLVRVCFFVAALNLVVFFFIRLKKYGCRRDTFHTFISKSHLMFVHDKRCTINGIVGKGHGMQLLLLSFLATIQMCVCVVHTWCICRTVIPDLGQCALLTGGMLCPSMFVNVCGQR